MCQFLYCLCLFRPLFLLIIEFRYLINPKFITKLYILIRRIYTKYGQVNRSLNKAEPKKAFSANYHAQVDAAFSCCRLPFYVHHIKDTTTRPEISKGVCAFFSCASETVFEIFLRTPLMRFNNTPVKKYRGKIVLDKGLFCEVYLKNIEKEIH